MTTFQRKSNSRILPQSNKIPIHQSRRLCDRSAQHGRAGVRHVEQANGRALNLCFACWRQFVATEVRDALIAQWDRLWKASPRLNRAGGAIGALAAMIGREGRAAA